MAQESSNDSGDRRVEIPVVDFSNWKQGATPEELLEVAEGIVSAFKSVGFVYILNHGMTPKRLAEAFSWSKRFFDLSKEQKLQAPRPDGPLVDRGYSWPGLEKVSQAMRDTDDPLQAAELRKVTDYKESYDMGSEMSYDEPNVWIPDETLPGFRKFMRQFYWDCFDVGSNILKAISLGLGLQEEHLLKFLSGHNNQLRLLHYPPIPATAMESGEMARMPAHTDWSAITMLFQDDCGGLEVQDIDHPLRYIPATPVENAIVVNVGDLLQRWTNDVLRSTKHRVTLPTTINNSNGSNQMVKERFLIPYFIAPDPDSIIDCLPTCTSVDRPARYFPVVHRQYNRARARMHHQDKASEPGTGATY